MLKNAIQRLVVAVLIMGMIVPPTGSARELNGEVEALPTSSGLYRTQVAVRQPSDWARLERMGVTVLEQGEDWALVLVGEDQLETLARLRFEPRGTDELGMLVTAHAQAKPWLAASLRPLLSQAAEVERRKSLRVEGIESAAADVRQMLQALTVEQQAGVSSLSSIDDDADGLTNTQEQWWCTDPLNPDSDGDGVDDGDEVHALLDGDTTDGPPYQGWPMVPGDSAYDPQCIDRDEDAVPDMAERWVIGLNANRETTDGDKFDDGQELFGITKSGAALPIGDKLLPGFDGPAKELAPANLGDGQLVHLVAS
ncbi:MAG: hypothetical protein H8E47_09090 [Anaerolineales bacterium]|nr:hypothetical protein [Anaerolineales bacterium]